MKRNRVFCKFPCVIKITYLCCYKNARNSPQKQHDYLNQYLFLSLHPIFIVSILTVKTQNDEAEKTSKDSGTGCWNHTRGSDAPDGILLHRLSQPYLLLASVCHLLPMRNTDNSLIGIRSKEAVEKKFLGFGIQR